MTEPQRYRLGTYEDCMGGTGIKLVPDGDGDMVRWDDVRTSLDAAIREMNQAHEAYWAKGPNGGVMVMTIAGVEALERCHAMTDKIEELIGKNDALRAALERIARDYGASDHACSRRSIAEAALARATPQPGALHPTMEAALAPFKPK